MKVCEIIEPIDERKALKHAALAAMAAASIGAAKISDAPGRGPEQQAHIAHVGKPSPKEAAKDVKPEKSLLAHSITKRYKVDFDLALEIVELAHKHERKDFPKAEDILAVIGVESTFNPDAKSKLPKDPAIGLMQVRPGIWDLDPHEVTDPEENIKVGVDILAKYYKRYRGDKRTALMAYNAGPTGKETSEYAPIYATKVEKARAKLVSDSGVSP